MYKYEETFATWNKVASKYRDKFGTLELYDGSYDLICNSIKKEKAKILEIGCGPGNITKYLLSKRPDFKIHGIDIAPNMIALAKESNPTAKFTVMDGKAIKEIQEKYDAVVCGFIIPYVSKADCKKLIKDSFGLLMDNGLIYLSFVEGDSEDSGFHTGSNGDRVYFHYHSLKEIKAILLELEFRDIVVYRYEYNRSALQKENHVVLVGKKKFND